jgi:hypothetical protein
MGVFTEIEREESDEGAVRPGGYGEDGFGKLSDCGETVNEMDKVVLTGCRTIARRRRDGMDLRTRGPRELPKQGTG